MKLIQQLTEQVESITKHKIIWEMGKKYIALHSEEGRVVAEYSPKTGKLIIK
jgi:hypothetical protein